MKIEEPDGFLLEELKRRLEELGYPAEKIEEIKAWFM